MTDDALSEFAPEHISAELMDQHVETSDRLVSIRNLAIAVASAIALAAVVGFLCVALASLLWAEVSTY
jgi:hypothetical protein